MGNKKVVKKNFFKEVYEEMRADESKSFWDLVPVRNTTMGRVFSYVVFRCVGIDISVYRRGLGSNQLNDRLGVVSESVTPTELANLEFINAWGSTQIAFASLLKEGLAFQIMLKDRDFQLWLANTLSKIPLAQWDRQKIKFMQSSGNAAYIVIYTAWRYALQGKSIDSLIAKLPKDLLAIEKYVIHKLLDDYKLDEELEQMLYILRDNAMKQSYKEMAHTRLRVNRIFGVETMPTTKEYTYSVTAAGKEYFQRASVLWGLWSMSTKEVLLENESIEDALPSLVHSLVTMSDIEYYSRLRDSFVYDWILKNPSVNVTSKQSNSEEMDKVVKDLELARRELSQARNKLDIVTKALEQEKEKSKDLLNKNKVLSEQSNEAKKNVQYLEKKLTKLTKELQEVKKVDEVQNKQKSSTRKEKVSEEKDLEKHLMLMEKQIAKNTERISDLYTLLSVEDADDTNEIEMSENALLNQLELEKLQTFKGRVVLTGGNRTWQERVHKWFESHGVKVRIYALGADVSGVKTRDVVLLNIICNKHKYSVKFMNDIRDIGAKMQICKLTNLEQTVQLVLSMIQN